MIPLIAAIEGRVRQLLETDPVCQGKVSATTIRAMALEFAREPEPDGDVLAERTACVSLLTSIRNRIAGMNIDVPDVVALEVRRLDAAIELVRQGLHRPIQGD